MALRIQPLHVGTVFEWSKPGLTYQRGWGQPAEVVFIMFLITGGEHPVLVDTGTASIEEVRERHNVTLVRPPEQEPLAVLKAAGVNSEDIGTVINTHLHWDHCSNNDLFPNADIVVQETEIAYAVAPLEPNRKVYERRRGMLPGWVRAIGNTRHVRGDVGLFPGISVVHLPGHSPGSQGVLVEAEGGRYLIAGDCVSCHENWEGDELSRHIPTGGFTNMHDFMDSFTKIEGLDCVVIPSHDPEVLEHKVYE